jgi:hypothetical protein
MTPNQLKNIREALGGEFLDMSDYSLMRVIITYEQSKKKNGKFTLQDVARIKRHAAEGAMLNQAI